MEPGPLLCSKIENSLISSGEFRRKLTLKILLALEIVTNKLNMTSWSTKTPFLTVDNKHQLRYTGQELRLTQYQMLTTYRTLDNNSSSWHRKPLISLIKIKINKQMNSKDHLIRYRQTRDFRTRCISKIMASFRFKLNMMLREELK